MEIIQFVQQNLILFLLTVVRVSSIFVSAPIFSSRNIPGRIKILIAIFIALVVFPAVLQSYKGAIPNELLPFIICVLTEFLIGVTIGFVMEIFFAIIQVAGQILDTQVGFGIVNVVDPQSGTQIPLLGNFVQVIFTVVFLASDMHHLFLIALIDSFEVLPFNHATMQPMSAVFVLKLFTDMFLLGFKIAMPMIMTTILVDISMGMLARTMPQMNVFVVGIPLKLAVGIFMLGIFLPTYIYILKVAYRGVPENIYKLLSIFAG